MPEVTQARLGGKLHGFNGFWVPYRRHVEGAESVSEIPV